ncbi:MAG: FlgD immunoglobulin-like domain containing protein [Nanoarchaeota archaeon]
MLENKINKLAIYFLLANLGLSYVRADYDNDPNLEYTWESARGSVYRYQVQMSVNEEPFKLVGNTPDSKPDFTITDALHGVPYRIRVRAETSEGHTGEWSEPSDNTIPYYIPDKIELKNPGMHWISLPNIPNDPVTAYNLLDNGVQAVLKPGVVPLDVEKIIQELPNGIEQLVEKLIYPALTNSINNHSYALNLNIDQGITLRIGEDFPINPYENVIVQVTTPKTLEFLGFPDNSPSDIHLISGINNLAFPLLSQPIKYTAYSLLATYPQIVAIASVDSDTQWIKFAAYYDEILWGEDFDIEPGKGYVVATTSELDLDISNENAPGPLAPSQRNDNNLPLYDSRNFFIISGGLIDEKSEPVPNNAVSLELITSEGNSNFQTTTGDSGKWVYTLPTNQGDKVRVSVTNREDIKPIEIKIDEQTQTKPYFSGDIQVNPLSTKLMQNYPNPFNPETWIPYTIKQDTDVKIGIYNVNGQLVRKIDLGHQLAGTYIGKDKSAYWDGRNDYDEQVASGIYFYKLLTDANNPARKMVLKK